jgi:precorrin-3B C17-methyltransferase
MANKVFVVGLGPGGEAAMTAQARAALEQAQVLCGYTVYVDLVHGIFPDKETYTTPMTREIDRCRWALETAASGKTVAMVCSGDAGVYGMAGPVLQLAPQWPQVEVEVVPGVTAALSGAAVLGAPLGHDFCVISLSDLLTPWEVIENRLRCAGMGDFSICLYNPSSRKRPDYLRRACDILLDSGKSPQTVCGLVRNIGREGEQGQMLTLGELRDTQVDMFTTVFIGSSNTLADHGRMITPRGYERKQLR